MIKGVGVDIVSIPRIEKFVTRFGNKALKKFLSKKEIKLAKSSKTIAGFWASKEALSKALGCGIGKELSFSDMRISKTKKGAPKIKLSKKIKKYHKTKKIKISISHDGNFAVAIALVI